MPKAKPPKVRAAASAAALSAVLPPSAARVKVGVFDLDGVLRGKIMARDKFVSALKNGFGFCDVVLGWDCDDQPYDNATFTGWHTAFPDAQVRLLPETRREIPDEPETPLFLGEFAGVAESVCPRGLLRRVLARAKKMGLAARAACEFEFFVFEETPHSLRDKGFRNLRPLTPGFFGYSVLRNSVHAEFHNGLMEYCARLGAPLEGLHTESGAGVLEAALEVCGALEAADRAALFKTFAKVFAQRRGLTATFMARWSPDWPGQSGHIHLSLLDGRGRNIFHDAKKPDGVSDAMRHFIGGQQALMPEWLALAAPTVNSFSRLVPGFWAPTSATWGVENRTCALRAISGGDKSQRVEYRVSAADINPYVAMAAALASGLRGIEKRIEPDPPVVGNAYDRVAADSRRFPATLAEAASRLRASAAAREWLGGAFVDHFAASREWEERQFRAHITDWELARYFEII